MGCCGVLEWFKSRVVDEVMKNDSCCSVSVLLNLVASYIGSYMFVKYLCLHNNPFHLLSPAYYRACQCG